MCRLGFVSQVFACSTVVLEHLKQQQEKADDMLRQLEYLKVNVDKVVEISEYTRTQWKHLHIHLMLWDHQISLSSPSSQISLMLTVGSATCKEGFGGCNVKQVSE